MKVARILKIAVIVEWVVGFIIGILAGTSGGSFSFLSSLYPWAVVFITGILQYAIAELLDNMIMIRNRTDEQLSKLTDMVYQMAKLFGLEQPLSGIPDSQTTTADSQSSEYGARNSGKGETGSVKTDSGPAKKSRGYRIADMHTVPPNCIVCPACGQVQRSNRDSCSKCGVIFIH
ncbi:MAG: hypothetical protein ACOX8Q_04715 [Christensenellales bacterium]|jgi:ribosomal protein L32